MRVEETLTRDNYQLIPSSFGPGVISSASFTKFVQISSFLQPGFLKKYRRFEIVHDGSAEYVFFKYYKTLFLTLSIDSKPLIVKLKQTRLIF